MAKVRARVRSNKQGERPHVGLGSLGSLLNLPEHVGVPDKQGLVVRRKESRPNIVQSAKKTYARGQAPLGPVRVYKSPERLPTWVKNGQKLYSWVPVQTGLRVSASVCSATKGRREVMFAQKSAGRKGQGLYPNRRWPRKLRCK